MNDKVELTQHVRFKIELIRYIRFVELFDDYQTNLYGITFNILLDYEINGIYLSYSACVEDNFNKRKGRELAVNRMKSGQYSFFPMNPRLPVRYQIMDWIKYSNDPEAKKLKRIITSILKKGYYIDKYPVDI